MTSLALILILTAAHLPWALALSYKDVKLHRLPNVLVLGMSGAVVLASSIYGLMQPASQHAIVSALILACVVGILSIGFALFFPSALGMGDAKTIPSTIYVATLFGAASLVWSLVWICLLGALIGCIVLVRTRNAKSRFAFGPVLLSAPYGGLAIAVLTAHL